MSPTARLTNAPSLLIRRGVALPRPPVLHNVPGGVEPRPYTVIARALRARGNPRSRARRRGTPKASLCEGGGNAKR